ncbi:MAG: thrombospondin type 3 repeat-containing protein [Flavobacteriales bacterium]
MLRHSLFLLGLLGTLLLNAQTSSVKNAVQVSATVQVSPARITLTWVPLAGSTGFTIYRKMKASTSWGSSIGTADGSATSYTDNSVVVGTYYEYKVVRTASSGTGYGYVASGIQVAPAEYNGKLVLLVDNAVAGQLTAELEQLQADLRADGWDVLRHDVARSAPVSNVRALVQADYNADPANVKAVYIVGHVPVPYSGNQNPDGHGDHQGAWPCDGYYGEMNGTWTDNSVNNTSGQSNRNWNTPGDGKFDQTDFPSAVELQVGRVDLYDMQAFPQGEVQLLKNYLNKAHDFKMKRSTPQARGIIFDNFQDLNYPLASGGYRSLSALVGASNITDVNPYGQPFTSFINGQSYLWTYFSGGGTWTYANNVGSTDDLAGPVSMGGVFNMSMGSYFGDWDCTNNFLRAPLASGNGLTNVWSAIPHWLFHHMGMGDNIGYSTWVTMNNTTLYAPQTGGWQGAPFGRVCEGLMGDPTLRMSVVAPPSDVQIRNNAGTAGFSWTASTEPVSGYYIYSIDAATGGVTRVVSDMVAGSSYNTPTIPFVAGRQFMVRAVKLETSNTGSYYNLSLGAIGTASGTASADCQGVLGGTAVAGSSCNDNNACTINDTWNANCQCVGTPSPDSDGDGICDATDSCPNKPGQVGSSCNDGNACTLNDVLNANCQCVGTQSPDSDGDGICDATDSCPSKPGQVGSNCNDGNACTLNDVLNANCQCVGTQSPDSDGDGICDATDSCPNKPGQVGSSCNDGNACTLNDVLNANCQCVGTQSPDSDGDGICDATDSCPNKPGQVGSSCNDGNACTLNDVLNANCQCVGTQSPDSDGDGICDATDSCPNKPGQVGSSCNDGNACTLNDVLNANCQCVGTQSLDSDGDGICDATDSCPNKPGQVGSSCNDGNACTLNDVLNANCQCVGTQSPDSDGDGICDATDSCPNKPGQVGSSCNDGNACTLNDVLNANCQCVGTQSPDSDGDGVCDAQDNCPNVVGQIGSSCNDGNASTINDVLNANCQCVGTAVALDCQGTPNGTALPGTACNDNNANTGNDRWTTNCECVGQVIDCAGVAGGAQLPGSACDDDNACTLNDVLNTNCQCIGTQSPDSDGDGICDAMDNCTTKPGQIGSSCNDGNACTLNDVLNANCQCVGTPSPDSDGDGICDAQDNCPNVVGQVGSSCNDGNACTLNDVLNANCQCVGTPSPDSDGDGICDAQDNCPNVVGQVGSSCNDGNACTLNDVLNANCQCIGTPSPDSDSDGICDAQDNCPNVVGQIGSSCNDGNASTINDVLNANCQCVGTAVALDCQGTPNGTALPGTACNDNNANTGNDRWTTNCECVGQVIDCAGVAGGTQLPGSACNDGNACTLNDVLNANCQCVGTQSPDSDGDGICDAQDNCPNVVGQIGSSCNDGNASTINDVLNANCQCVGTAVVLDCQGTPNGTALPGTACNDNNANTSNDRWTPNCECVGQVIDCAGVAGGVAAFDQCGICAGGNTGIIPDADEDQDGLIACEDNCLTIYNPGQADFDGDGVGDACDNCVWLANEDQADVNGNGIGDVCEDASGIAEMDGTSGFGVFPNPAHEHILVRSATQAARGLRFYDLAGQVAMEIGFDTHVDVSRLAMGTYIIFALDAEGRPLARTRLIKQ